MHGKCLHFDYLRCYITEAEGIIHSFLGMSVVACSRHMTSVISASLVISIGGTEERVNCLILCKITRFSINFVVLFNVFFF